MDASWMVRVALKHVIAAIAVIGSGPMLKLLVRMNHLH